MKPNNLFKFFVNFFYSIKNIYFPDILPHFKQKKISIYFEKKIQPRCFDIREKFLFNNRYFKKKFYSKLRNMSGKLKKNFSWSRITYLNFLWNFFTQLKIYIFPIYYRILNKTKNFLYISKKKSSLDASIFAKNFCSIIAILKKNFILNCVICREN